jgi:predicted phosphodiesterase
MILRGRLSSRNRHAKIIPLRQASCYRAPSRYCVRGNADRAMIETFDGTADPAGILTAWASIQLTRDERGHTHMQFDRQAGRYRLINAGSVGMPYGQSGAY